MEESADNLEKSKELSEIYTVFKEIFSKAPPILSDLSSSSVDIDYKECVDAHIDFKTIDAKFEDEKYNSVTDAITDIRHVFLNCYKYYGTRSNHTLKALKIEELFEQKISCLNENLKLLADVKLTFNKLNMDGKSITNFRYPKNCYDSVLLRCVAHCRPERLKQYHKILSTTLTTDEDNAHTLEELMSWENEIYFNDHYRYISSMWELPEIGNFVAIIFKEFDFDIVNQGEIERMFLMPKESQTMGKILTTLLMPFKKNKCSDEILPYQIWSEKLNTKVSEWFKIYHLHKKNKVRVLDILGIHPDFWAVIGDTNPLNKYDYCELSYFMKVWLVKGLCDYITVKYKTINDVILNCNERQCTIWKNDLATEEYFFFNSMPDLRVYYYNIPDDEPSLDFLESEKGNEEKRVDDEHDDVLIPSISNVFHAKSRVKPNETNFKLIADSVQGLRSFLDELDTEDTSVPESLINAFEDFIDKIEPEECNYIVLNNNSKIKLFKDWKSYLERSKNDNDRLLVWKGKKLKSPEDLNGEIIFEKRKRKPVLMQEFNQEYLNSDDFYNESSDNLSDLSDSEDEWGALNQSKNKAKQPIQTPSKVIELEKRLKEEDKIMKQGKIKSFNSDFKLCKTMITTDSDYVKDENEEEENEHKSNLIGYNFSEKLVGSENVNTVQIKSENIKEENLVNNSGDTVVNDFNEDSVCLNNIETVSIDIKEVSSDDDTVLIGGGEEENKNPLTTNKKKYVEKNEVTNEQPVPKKSKTTISEDLEIVGIDDAVQKTCQTLRKNSSEIIVLDNLTEESGDINEKNKCNNKKSPELKTNVEVISIEDDDEQIVISDDEDVQIISMNQIARNSPIKINGYCTLRNNLNKSLNLVPKRKQMVTANRIASTSIPKLSPNISIMPANVHLPKGIQVTMIKKPQTLIPTHFNATKRSFTKNPSTVDVECRVISKPNVNGEVKFYVNLPNGKLHPVSDELMNKYLKDHNNVLPDYWLVPLPVEVAKQYGFN